MKINKMKTKINYDKQKYNDFLDTMLGNKKENLIYNTKLLIRDVLTTNEIIKLRDFANETILERTEFNLNTNEKAI